MKTNIKLLLTLLLLGTLTGCTDGGTKQDGANGDNPTHKPGNNPDQKPGDNPTSTPTDTPVENPDDDTPPPVVTQQSGWYMRTVTTASLPDGTTFTHKTAGVFGELDESKDGKDRHDIPSYDKAVLQSVFVNDNIDPQNTYYSDYRHYGQSGKEVWTFQVKNQQTTNLANAAIHFEVEGPYTVYRNTKETSPRYIEQLSKDDSKKRALTLVDVDNQRTYSYDELKTADLSMDGKHTRTFRWVLGDVSNEDMQPLQANVSTQSLQGQSTQNAESDFIPAPSDGTFGTPPEL